MQLFLKSLKRYIKTDIFRTPAARLAGWYVLILMFMSLLFSIILYHFAIGELHQGLSHQYLQLGGLNGLPLDADNISSPVQANLETVSDSLVLKLIYFNTFILLASGFLSYFLAKRTLKPIEAALEAQTRFTSDASHELRTPLAVMQTEIEIARTDPELTKHQALALLDSNLEEVKKLHRLSDGLLRLARSESKPLEMKTISLDEVAAEAVDRVRTSAKARNIIIRLDTLPVMAQGDHESLVELTAILLDNAIKYSDAAQAITLTTAKDSKEAWLSVVDTGRGISNADLPHVFDRFYRAEKSRTGKDVAGHGLGLSLAKKIADLHSAEIAVTSRLAHGSTFTLKLPRS
jgi:two-component system sensor histidine kinase CiaH